jgi:hypothetical protein
MHIFKLVYSSWTKSNYFFSMNNYCSIFFKTLWSLLYTFMLLRASPKIKTYLIWSKNIGYGLWLLCLTPLSTMFKLYRGGQFVSFIGGVPGKNYDLSQVTDKHYYKMLYRVRLSMIGIWTHDVSDDRHWLHR